jgi:hypothetical protein
MRIDLYTKTILTIIALLLAVMTLKPIIQPASASAQASLSGVQFTTASGGFNAFDTRNGDVWLYSYNAGVYGAKYLGRIAELGRPLVNR